MKFLRVVIPKTTEYKMKMPPTSNNSRGPISLIGGGFKKLRRLLQRKRNIKVEFRVRLMALLHCEMFRATCLAIFWRHCGGTSYTKHFTV